MHSPCHRHAAGGGGANGRGSCWLFDFVLLLQGILTLLRKSLGSAFRAIFGWATLALFGSVAQKDRTLLSIVVAAAGVWPIMLLGTLLPRTGAFLLAFVPIPKSIPTEVVRAVWIGLTALVPVAVGWVLRRRSADASKTARLRDWLMGFPVTLGLAGAFTFACIAVPVRKLMALATGRKEAHIPLVIPPQEYRKVAEEIRNALARGKIALERKTPPWTTRAISRTMRALGGSMLGAYLPEDLEYMKGPDLELTVYPNGVRVLGPERAASRAHALIAESATRTAALQTMTPKAQEIEKRIKALLAQRDRGAKSEPIVRSLAVELADANLDYEEWETLYRELLQLTVEVRGGGELLQRSAEEDPMPRPTGRPRRGRVQREPRQNRDDSHRKPASGASSRTMRAVQAIAAALVALLVRKR